MAFPTSGPRRVPARFTLGQFKNVRESGVAPTNSSTANKAALQQAISWAASRNVYAAKGSTSGRSAFSSGASRRSASRRS